MAENKDFDSIMREITGGMSGDAKEDMAYLQDQMEKYKDHEMGKEIIRACGRLMYEQVKNNLRLTLDIVENCGDAYRNASDTIKKLMNQAIFNKIYIISNEEIDLDTEISFRPPFDKKIDPIKEDIAQINRNTNTDRASTSLEKAKGHIQEYLECGLSDVDNPSNISTYPNNEKFFSHNSLSKALLVEAAGIEPASENRFTRPSPSADGYLHSLMLA